MPQDYNSRIINAITLLILVLNLTFLINTDHLFVNEQHKSESPTIQDVNRLITNFQELHEPDENLYLIFFDRTSDFENFITTYTTKMVFKGLEGVVIQATPSTISRITDKLDYLSSNNIHEIFDTPHCTQSFDDYTQNSIINPKIQTISSAQKIGVNSLWDLGYRGQGVTIGIFDSGVNDSHRDFSFPNGTSRVLANISIVNTIGGYSTDQEPVPGSHGTGVAGFAAGGGINNPNYIGMAPEAWLLDVDLDSTHDTDDLDGTGGLGEIAAVNWAIENGVDVINRSYGPPDPADGYLAVQYDPYERMMVATIRQAVKKGVLFAHSAGNYGWGDFSIDPTNSIHEMTVGATEDSMNSLAIYSSTGPIYGSLRVGPDVVAPGGSQPSNTLYTTAVNGGYFTTQGTSQSSPHVAGAAAVLLSAMREQGLDVNPGSLKAALMASASIIGEESWRSPWRYGTGQINATAAYELMINTPRIGNHPIVGAVNPRNISQYPLGTYPYPEVYLGTNYNAYHMTFVSSELNNVSVVATGNLSTILSFSEQILANHSSGMRFQLDKLEDGTLSEYYSHDIVFDVSVPLDNLIGTYSGKIVFRVNSTEIISMPYSINVKQPEKRILLYTANSNDFHYSSFGEFRNLVFDLAKKGIILNENNSALTTDVLSGYDTLWIAAGNRTYSTITFYPDLDAYERTSEFTSFSEEEQIAVLKFVKAGGGVILTPYSTPLGVESLINKWGIFTSEIPSEMGQAPSRIWHSNSIGKSFDFVQPSGSFYSTKFPAVSLAYQNERDKVVMASYDDPLGGRVVIMSGSNFITNINYPDAIAEEIFNDRVTNEIIGWVANDEQLFGAYEIDGTDISFTLHTSVNGSPSNSGGIIGKRNDLISGSITDITDQIPTTGNNGWYNFTFTIEKEGSDLFNFSWNSEFVAFELITDSTPPVVTFSGIENNSKLFRDTYLTFWFYDLESGINIHNAKMTLDGNQIGFYSPKENKTGIGFYVEKKLFIESYTLGSHTLIFTIFDIAGNSASTKFVFIVTSGTDVTTTVNNGPGLEWDIFMGIAIISLILSRKFLWPHFKNK